MLFTVSMQSQLPSLTFANVSLRLISFSFQGLQSSTILNLYVWIMLFQGSIFRRCSLWLVAIMDLCKVITFIHDWLWFLWIPGWLKRVYRIKHLACMCSGSNVLRFFVHQSIMQMHLEFNDVNLLRFFRTVNALLRDAFQFTSQSFNFWLVLTVGSFHFQTEF